MKQLIIAIIVIAVVALYSFADGFVSAALRHIDELIEQADRDASRISDLERELGHREAELDALADQLDSAVAELHAAGSLLKRHGIEYTPDLEAIEPIE